MKKLILFLILLSATPALACDRITRQYNTATTVDFCLYTTDATVGAVKKEDAAHASGDTYIMKDEGAEANTTNAFVDEGSCYSIALTATEMQAARVTLNIEDQGTKAWADKCVVIETYGNASAQHGTPDVNVTQISGDTNAADNLEAAADGTGYNLGGGSIVAASVTTKTGYQLSATGVDDIWDEAISGHSSAGTTGKAVSDALAAVDTEVAAVKAKTDNLPSDPADESSLQSAISGISGGGGGSSAGTKY